MAESTIVVSLRNKRDEMERAIDFMEAKIAELRANLVHVNAVLHLYEGEQGPEDRAPYRMKLGKAFAPGEFLSLSLAILRERGVPMTSGELADVIMAQKGWSASDLVLRRSVVKRLSEALAKAHRRKAIGSSGMLQGSRVWTLA